MLFPQVKGDKGRRSRADAPAAAGGVCPITAEKSSRNVQGEFHLINDIFATKRFDLIFSGAVFKHLAMPWIVSKQLISPLKVGGYVVTETHFSHSSHMRPWHFFQFSDMGLRVLFPHVWGIRCIDSGMSNPIVGFFSEQASPYLRYAPVTGLYCHAKFLGRKEVEILDTSWERCDASSLVMGTTYPYEAGLLGRNELRRRLQQLRLREKMMGRVHGSDGIDPAPKE